MKIEISNQKIDKITADIKVIFVIDKNLNHHFIKDNNQLDFLGYKGNSEETALLVDKKVLYVGCESLDADEIRLASSIVIKTLKKTDVKTIKIGTYTDNCPIENIKAMTEGFILGAYCFDTYKSKKTTLKIQNITISTEDYSNTDISIKTAQEAIKVATIISKATNFSKTLINTIPYEMDSLKLADMAQELDTYKNVTCNVYGQEFLEEQKMGAFLAVNRASHIPPRLIHLIYKPKNAKKRFVYVGKGLTYDTGGLSLKPGDFMVSMKSDMSGAAAVLGILKGASQLELPYEIHAIIGATENAIGPEAYKPDDVLKAKNGKTIEVRNTDAEGRLVLADCLCYAQDQKPDVLIDMATLTGACVVALGEYTTGVMGHSSKLKRSFVKSANNSGELTGTLPFNKYLKKILKSHIADISNIASSRYGGAITAGLFLDNFIEDENKDKWLHLDIAGPAFVEKDWGYNQHGASGAGVRMNLYWMIEQSKEEEL